MLAGWRMQAGDRWHNHRMAWHGMTRAASVRRAGGLQRRKSAGPGWQEGPEVNHARAPRPPAAARYPSCGGASAPGARSVCGRWGGLHAPQQPSACGCARAPVDLASLVLLALLQHSAAQHSTAQHGMHWPHASRAVCVRPCSKEGLADEGELQAWFLSRVNAYLRCHGRVLVGWDEVGWAGRLLAWRAGRWALGRAGAAAPPGLPLPPLASTGPALCWVGAGSDAAASQTSERAGQQSRRGREGAWQP